MKRPLSLALLLACALCQSALVLADDTPEAPPQMTIDQLRSRLNLTPEQEARIAPLAEQRKAKLEEVRGKLAGATSRRDKGAAMREAKQAQDAFVKAVDPILTPEQQSEWEKIREEGKKQLKERWQQRQ